MAVLSLHSFITTHERKFQAKLDAAAQDRQTAIHRQALGTELSKSLRGLSYRSAIRQRFAPLHHDTSYLRY
jgi:hypothetical protein